MAKIKYSEKVISRTKYEVKKEITLSLESTPELRKEIAKVFQTANRRIQNIEKAGYLSPAVEALNLEKGGYSKFNFKDKTWADLKIEYAKAVSFLQKPTSTATGAKQYENHIKDAYELEQVEFDAIKHKLQNKFLSPAEQAFDSSPAKRYKDFSGEFETYKNSLADQIEGEGKALENTENLDRALDRDLSQIIPEIEKDQAAKEIGRILLGFSDFDI